MLVSGIVVLCPEKLSRNLSMSTLISEARVFVLEPLVKNVHGHPSFCVVSVDYSEIITIYVFKAPRIFVFADEDRLELLTS